MRILPIHAYFPSLYGLLYNAVHGEAAFPFYASFKLTSRCHFRCPFCNVRGDRAEDLPIEDIKAILRNLSRSSVLMTSFEGGEPLLRPDIGELLAFARRCSFYLLFTTSAKNLDEYPLDEYSRYIDFLHVSIDEGHDNLALFDQLPRLCTLPLRVSVQTVVTAGTIDALDEKVERCCRAGAGIVVIPAAHVDHTADHFPDMARLERKLRELRIRFPATIHTPPGFFDAFRRRRCSTAAVVIAPDGRLYYPCHVLGDKGPDLRTTPLTAWLASPEALLARRRMRRCTRNCGWYQYYAINSYTSLWSIWEALRPALTKRKVA